MKTFIKSAFFLVLMFILMFGGLSVLCFMADQPQGAILTTAVTTLFLMILPACSTTN